jgi:hypothetical protein
MEICSLVPVFTYPPLPYVYVFTISTIKKSFFGIKPQQLEGSGHRLVRVLQSVAPTRTLRNLCIAYI